MTFFPEFGARLSSRPFVSDIIRELDDYFQEFVGRLSSSPFVLGII